MEEDLNKSTPPHSRPRKKRTLRRQSKFHVFVKQVCFSYGESPRTPPLEGTSLHRRNISVERPWGILSLFTACLPLWVKSSRQSRCHMSPTQELRTFIFRRKCSLARKNRTRRKKSTVEDALKIPEKNKKNEVPEQLKSTESLKNKATKKKKEPSMSKQPWEFPLKEKERDTKKTVKMSRLCKAGLFFLRWITADPSPWGNFTPPTKH